MPAKSSGRAEYLSARQDELIEIEKPDWMLQEPLKRAHSPELVPPLNASRQMKWEAVSHS